MTPDEAGFFRTILDHPDDDTPRLIYADWLEDRGETERAEFIRVQCELANRMRRKKRYGHLQKRSEELWPAPLKHYMGNSEISVQYVRGFAEKVRLQGKHALDQYLSISAFRNLGPVQNFDVRADCHPGDFAPVPYWLAKALAGFPALQWVRELRVCHTVLKGVEALIVSPHLSAVATIRIDVELEQETRGTWDRVRRIEERAKTRFGERIHLCFNGFPW